MFDINQFDVFLSHGRSHASLIIILAIIMIIMIIVVIIVIMLLIIIIIIIITVIIICNHNSYIHIENIEGKHYFFFKKER